jgi:hypothetical protein
MVKMVRRGALASRALLVAMAKQADKAELE